MNDDPPPLAGALASPKHRAAAGKPKAPPRAPAHLSKRSRAFWRDIVGTFDLEAHRLELLRSCCEAIDRRDQAAELLLADGLTMTDRYGQTKPHPAASIEAQARIAVARLLRELRLDESTADARPPRQGRRT